MEGEDPRKKALELAWNHALRRVARRERTVAEIRRHLLDLDHAPDVVEETIRELAERRYLDDERYAAAFSRMQALRGKGPAYIRRKLKEKGITVADREISGIVEAVEGKTDLDRAREIVERRYPEFREDRTVARKAYAALVRRGFSFDVARKAVSRRAEL